MSESTLERPKYISLKLRIGEQKYKCSHYEAGKSTIADLNAQQKQKILSAVMYSTPKTQQVEKS